MNLRRLKHTLLRLSLEEKVIGLGTLLMMVGCFLPWYSMDNIVNKEMVTEYGLTGDLGVIGFVIFLMSFLGLVVMVADNMRIPFPKFGYRRESMMVFFVGEAAFLTLLTMAIYTKRSLDFTEADLRFGILLVLAASLFSTLAAFSLLRKIRHKEAAEFWAESEFHPLEEQELERDPELSKEAIDELSEELTSFQEDNDVLAQIEEHFEEEEKKPESSPSAPKVQETPPSPHQSNYFMREAGIADKKQEDAKEQQ